MLCLQRAVMSPVPEFQTIFVETFGVWQKGFVQMQHLSLSVVTAEFPVFGIC